MKKSNKNVKLYVTEAPGGSRKKTEKAEENRKVLKINDQEKKIYNTSNLKNSETRTHIKYRKIITKFFKITYFMCVCVAG